MDTAPAVTLATTPTQEGTTVAVVTANATEGETAQAPAPSCNGCPSFLKPHGQLQVLGTNLGAPICGRKLIPLSAPAQGSEVAKKVFKATAEGCADHGKPVEGFTRIPDTAVLPMRVGVSHNTAEPEAFQGNARCSSCENFVPQRVVQQETGWTASLCKATGSLIPDGRTNAYAAKCGQYVRLGAGQRPRESMDGFTLFPMFSKDFGKVDGRAAFIKSLDSFVDPKVYPNQRPLTSSVEAGMKRRGIRAWREVADPTGFGKPVYLPIFDRDALVPVIGKDKKPTGEMVHLFSDHDRELIPNAEDEERPHFYADHGQILYRQAVLWMKLDETPAWWGQGGVGKTEFARHLAWLMQLPFHRLNITSSSEVDDLVGKVWFEDNATVFKYGRLPSAWMKPGVLLLDEPNTGPPDVWQVIRPLTDNSRMLVLDQNSGERVRRHEDCYFALAMNPAWDPRNVGTQTIGDADGSRLMHVFFQLPPPALEKEILFRRAKLDGFEPDGTVLDKVLSIATEIRNLSNDGQLHTTWGLRHQIKVIRALQWFEPMIAYRLAVGDSMEPMQWEIIVTIIKQYFGN